MTARADDREVLPRWALPEIYNVQLEPDFSTYTYQGYETILLNVLEPTNVVVLNAKCLEVQSAKVVSREGKEIHASTIEFNVQKETVLIHIEEALNLGTGHILHVAFNGILNDELCGFYRSRLRSGNDDEYIAVTHFEASNARRAFPCFDEPAMKASFVISLVVDPGMVALSNMNVIKEELSYSPFDKNQDVSARKKNIVIFAPTPPMSTYLVAFAVGNLGYIEAIMGPDIAGASSRTISCSVSTTLDPGQPINRWRPPSTQDVEGNETGAGPRLIFQPPNGSVDTSLDAAYDTGAGPRLIFQPPNGSVDTTFDAAYDRQSVSSDGSFESDASAFRKPVRVRVYCPKEKIRLGEFALGIAVQALAFYSDAFCEPYPLDKLDMISVVDFEIGAMENWGLITFRELAILIDSKAGKADRKESIAETVCHEVAHMWFGNLVTMEWWQDLWLKEGFATWASYLALDYIYPEWDAWAKFVTDYAEAGMAQDALESTHPIEVVVRSPAEVTQIFDGISYYKGASIIRMLCTWLGKTKFLNGIRIYMQVHRFGNATTKDLWRCLSQASGVDITAFMSNWTQKPGFPVVSINETAGSDGVSKLTLRQERFFSRRPDGSPGEPSSWSVPSFIQKLSVPTGNASDRQVCLQRDSEVTKDLGPMGTVALVEHVLSSAFAEVPNAQFSAGQPYLVNKSRCGFYRVLYPAENMIRLARLIEQGSLKDTADRIGLLADAASLARAGYACVTDLLNLCVKFKNETKFTVLNEISGVLREIADTWYDAPESVLKPLDGLTHKMFKTQAAQLGWKYPDGEHHLTSQLRTLAITKCGLAGDVSILTEARKLFQQYTSGKTDCLHDNVRLPVFLVAVKHGTAPEFETMLDLFRRSRDPEERFAAVRAAAYTPHPELTKVLLELLLNGELGPSELSCLYPGLASSWQGRDQFWAYFTANWDKIKSRLQSNRHILAGLISSVARFSSEERATDVETFFEGKDVKDFNRRLRETLERIRVRAAWRRRDTEKLERWLKDFLTGTRI